jgi:hypothetical protein
MTTIYANYEVCSTWDLDEVCNNLGIERSQVRDYDVKWDQLVLTYIDNDGCEITCEIDPEWPASDFDFKRPTSLVEEHAEPAE